MKVFKCNHDSNRVSLKIILVFNFDRNLVRLWIRQNWYLFYDCQQCSDFQLQSVGYIPKTKQMFGLMDGSVFYILNLTKSVFVSFQSYASVAILAVIIRVFRLKTCVCVVWEHRKRDWNLFSLTHSLLNKWKRSIIIDQRHCLG